MMNRVRYRMNESRLIEVNPLNDTETPGIFTVLQTIDGIPWSDKDIASLLNLYYYGNHSGNKIISPLVEKLLGDNEKLTSDNITSLAQIAFNIFGDNWARLWAINVAEYNPIENYDMTEEGTENTVDTFGKTSTRTDDLTHGKTGTDTQTPNLTEVAQRNIYGFNDVSSGDGQPSEKVTTQNTGNNQMSYNTQDTETGTQTNADTGHNDKEVQHTLTRHGNIGVTTSQQMIQSEIELWKWDFFNMVVFPDMDRVMTIQTY